MIRLPLLLSVRDAEAIAGTLSKPTAMPGYSYSLDAHRCREGSRLRAIPGSVCSDCYACRGAYVMPHVPVAQQRRHNALDRPRWVDAMVVLVAHYCRPPDHYFRWHDSGDLQSVDHLRKIVAVCERTPTVKHWLPTREYDDVAAFLRGGDRSPENIVVRLSARMIDEAPDVPSKLAHLPTSTVHTISNPLPVKGSIVCRATTDGRDKCGRCRACWNPKVSNVSYRRH